jgi:hypothetical protein
MSPSLYYTTLALIIYVAIALLTTIALAAEPVASTSYQYTSYRPINSTTAGIELPWDSHRWHTEHHPEPAQFTITDTGEVFGITTTGIPFTQINLPNEFGIKAQRFTMQNHSHLILNGEAIYDLHEFSIRLHALAASRQADTVSTAT